jgi:hypothetical protein
MPGATRPATPHDVKTRPYTVAVRATPK